jgi:hypothetical protein
VISGPGFKFSQTLSLIVEKGVSAKGEYVRWRMLAETNEMNRSIAKIYINEIQYL